MNITTPNNVKIMGALLGVMVATLAHGAATLRYVGSGDYNDLFSVTGVNGWPDGGGGTGGLPGPADTIRINFGDNTVTITNVVPDVGRFQIGVDESGRLVVEAGGKLRAVGTSANRVGNNGATVTGRLTVNTNGEVDSIAVLELGAGASTGILAINGGTVNVSSHLWVGSSTSGTGTIVITNGGSLNLLGAGGNGMLGLGTLNAVSPSGGTGTIKVGAGGLLNLFNIEPSGSSIQPGSVLDISGNGVVTIPGDRSAAMTNYVNAGKITAYGGTGTVSIDYNTANPGKTTLTAIGGYVPPTAAAWNPAANPSGKGLWNEGANWTGGLRPVGVTETVFNILGATPCIVNDSEMAKNLLMGTNGPGGTLIVTNGGSLACSAEAASVLGVDSNALMVVESGGAVTFASDFWLGLQPGSDGTLVMHGGTVSVSGMFGLGYYGGTGTVRISGGTLNLSQWDYFNAIQGSSVLDVSGTGVVVINGNYVDSVNGFVSLGLITANGGTGTVMVDYNYINVGKTTIYPSGLDLAPAQVTWDPASNPASTGFWSESANWTGGHAPGAVTVVTFNATNATPCTVSNAAVARYVAMGNTSGPGGTLIITNGGSLTTGTDNWSAVGYASNALMVVQTGGSASFGYHLWVGFDPGAEGTLLIDGGKVEVGGMFGLGWNGGTGTVIVTNGGSLILHQWHPTDSIKGPSVLNLTGTGAVVITGNYAASVSNYVSSGKITANGGPNVAYSFDSGANTTTLQVAPQQQSVTKAALSGGNLTLTYQTTPGHFYHLESTPSLTPAVWTRVAGSTTNAPGAAVSFSVPTGGTPMFYRSVSP